MPWPSRDMPLAHGSPAVCLQTLLPWTPTSLLPLASIWQWVTPLGSTPRKEPRWGCMHKCTCASMNPQNIPRRIGPTPMAALRTQCCPPGCSCSNRSTTLPSHLSGPTVLIAMTTLCSMRRWAAVPPFSTQHDSFPVAGAKRMNLRGADPKCVCITNAFQMKN